MRRGESKRSAKAGHLKPEGDLEAPRVIRTLSKLTLNMPSKRIVGKQELIHLSGHLGQVTSRSSLKTGDGKTRIGPWLLLDSHDEVRAILSWGNITDEELAEHESSIRRWGVSSAVLNLTNRQLAALIHRGRGWPWNGYELRLMKEAGKYPPARLRHAPITEA